MSAYNKWFDNKKTYCLITGASRGLGKTLALRFAERFGPDSVLVLIATDLTKLQECEKEANQLAPKVKVSLHQLDLSKPETGVFEQVIKSSLSNNKAGDFEQAIIVHNAATIGPIKLAVDASDPAEWESYMRLNLSSPICLNSVFLKSFDGTSAHKLIINITSLAAFCPMLSAGFYNTGKAARDIFFQTLAEESPDVTVLSYSPGLLYTDMADQVLNKIAHPTARQVLEDARAKGLQLTCDQTTNKLIELLKTGGFKSGERIDYHGRHKDTTH